MTQALVFESTGDWKDALKLVERPVREVGVGQVRLRMLAAAIHPSDFGQIAGTYGKARSLPAVGGREGVGEIVEVGKRVRGLRKGQWVRLPEDQGVWRTEVVAEARGLYALPKDVPATQLALSFINPPTAWRVLHDFAALKRGDSVITNAGKSAVSEALIKLGASMGLKVYAVVRGLMPEVAETLRLWGAAGSFDESEEYFKTIKTSLALNQVGGESVLRLIKSLKPGGVCVTIGGATKEPVRYPTRELIFSDVVLRGFWMDKWTREASPRAARKLMKDLWARMQKGKLSQTIAETYPLADFAKALDASQATGRIGKILFTCEK